MYQLSSGDLGAYIEVTVTPVDYGEEYTGTAEAKYGPVSLSPKLRQNLEYALAAGGSTFTLYLAPDSMDTVTPTSKNEVRLQVNREEMIIQVMDSHGAVNEALSMRTGYTIDYPSISLHPFDTKRFTLSFKHQGKPHRLQLQSLTRQNRDLVVLTLRCLAARKYLINSKTLQDLFSTEGNLQSQGGTVSSPLDLTLEIDRLMRELYSLLQANTSLAKERNTLKSELQAAEIDMQETIASYQTILTENSSENRIITEFETQKNALREQLVKKNLEIDDLKGKIQILEENVKDLRQKTDKSELENLINEQNELISMLKKRQNSDDSLKNELKILQEKVNFQENLLEKTQFQEEKFRKEFEKIKEENTALLGQRGILSKKIDKLGEELEKKEKELEEMAKLQEENRIRQEIALQKLLSEMESLENQQPASEAEITRLTEENRGLKSQCDALSAQLSRAQAMARRNRGDL